MLTEIPRKSPSLLKSNPETAVFVQYLVSSSKPNKATPGITTSSDAVEAAINAGISSILYLDPASPGSATGKETYLVHDLLEIPLLTEHLQH